jgi:hypothetical protein
MLLSSVRNLYRSAAREFCRAKKAPNRSIKLAYLASVAEYTELGMGFCVLEVQRFTREPPVQRDLFSSKDDSEGQRLAIVKELSRISRLRIAAGVAACEAY